MKITKNIENYVKNRVDAMFTSVKLAEEKAKYDARNEIRIYKTLLDKELAIAVPNLINQFCIDHGIDTKKYEFTVHDMHIDVSFNDEIYSKIKNNYGSIYTKILIKLEMEKSSNLETIDYIINSILYPEPEVKSTVEGGEEDVGDTVSDDCKNHH